MRVGGSALRVSAVTLHFVSSIWRWQRSPKQAGRAADAPTTDCFRGNTSKFERYPGGEHLLGHRVFVFSFGFKIRSVALRHSGKSAACSLEFT